MPRTHPPTGMPAAHTPARHTLRSTPRSTRGGRLRTLTVAVAAAAHVATGCYSEMTVGWQAAPETRDVDVVLDPAETAPLAATLGPRASVVTGRVSGRTDSTLSLVVTGVTRTNGTEENWPASAVVLPARTIDRVTVRRLSGLRTALVGIGIAGAGALVGTLATGAAFSGGRPGQTPGRQ